MIESNRLIAALRAIVAELLPDVHFLGLYEYRVRVAYTDRLDLDPAAKKLGALELPELRGVPVRPGIWGASGKPTIGAPVLVSFVNGQRTRPVVTHVQGRDGAGFVPLEVSLVASSKVQIGGDASNETHVDASSLVRVGEHSDEVRLGSGSVPADPLTQNGRVLRYGDQIIAPTMAELSSGSPMPFTMTAPTGAPVARVKG